jgi:hypothetical protein
MSWAFSLAMTAVLHSATGSTDSDANDPDLELTGARLGPSFAVGTLISSIL